MELDFIDWLRERLPDHPHLRLGVGDDAAVLRWAQDHDCVITTDLLADGVHFDLDQAEPARVGRKLLAVNLSDLAAMAAHPHSAVVSLLLPNARARPLAVGLLEGMLPLASQFNVAIAGGDTNCWDGPLVASVAAIGQLTERGPLLRRDARPGDSIIVTGSFGGSILGKHYDFTPRVAESLLLHSQYSLHAAIDVSDGLTLDLWRICQASGCGAVLNLDCVPVSAAAAELARRDASQDGALLHALADGEDFELILAVPPGEDDRLLAAQPLAALAVPLTRIGQFVEQPGLWNLDSHGTRRPLAVRGYQHGKPLAG